MRRRPPHACRIRRSSPCTRRFSADGCFYLVSELVEGETLGALFATDALEDEQLLEIGIALADALGHAHARGVVHRDIKPQNVLVPRRDEGAVAKLTDFGGASLAGEQALTRTGDVIGTLAYMAPEQSEGREAGAQADLYSLALVLYEGSAGVNPVRGPDAGGHRTAPRAAARAPGAPPPRPPAAAHARDRPRARRPTRAGAAPWRSCAPRSPRRSQAPSPASARARSGSSRGARAGGHHEDEGRGHPAQALLDAAADADADAQAAAEPQTLEPRRGPLVVSRKLWLGWRPRPRRLAGSRGAHRRRPARAGRVAAAARAPAPRRPRLAGRRARAGARCLVGLAGVLPRARRPGPLLARPDGTGRARLLVAGARRAAAGRRLWLGPAPGTPARAAWEGSLSSSATHVLAPLLTPGWLLGAAAVGARRARAAVDRARPQRRAGRRRRRHLDGGVAAAAALLDAGVGAAAQPRHAARAWCSARCSPALVAVAARALRGPV